MKTSRLPTHEAGWKRLRALGLSLAAAAAIAACSPAPTPVSASGKDPSNPAAPEGVPFVVNAGSTSSTSERSPPPDRAQGSPHESRGHSGHAHDEVLATADAGLQREAFVCPMHPEVTSKAPGLCPKCNMKLVPKK